MNRSYDDESPYELQPPPRNPCPKLPAAADLPRFAEEGERDPFGQNEELLNRASRNAFRVAVELATLAHARGLCMMLPWSEPPIIDPSLRPWRSVVSCEPDERESSPAAILPPVVCWEGAQGTSIQNLTQRAALCVAALGEGASSATYEQLAELLEDLGYIALGREFHRHKIDGVRAEGMPLQFFYTIGMTAAKLYNHNIIHGDMTVDNFLYDADRRTAVMSDVGTACFLKRQLTLEEHASDVGLLKLTCSFEEWEAVKLGYREQAPELAARLFKLI